MQSAERDDEIKGQRSAGTEASERRPWVRLSAGHWAEDFSLFFFPQLSSFIVLLLLFASLSFYSSYSEPDLSISQLAISRWGFLLAFSAFRGRR
jgi:hypothetical protein